MFYKKRANAHRIDDYNIDDSHNHEHTATLKIGNNLNDTPCKHDTNHTTDNLENTLKAERIISTLLSKHATYLQTPLYQSVEPIYKGQQ